MNGFTQTTYSLECRDLILGFVPDVFMVSRGFLLPLLLAVPVCAFALGAPEPLPDQVAAATPVVAEDVRAVTPTGTNADPWEKYNRAIFRFNDKADHYVLKPVAKGYVAITPKLMRTGITNFFTNLRSPIVILNDVLQGKVKQAGSDIARFVVNTTAGVAGFIDVAVHLKLPLHDEDFGQTLGKWGMNSGPYLMLPFWGPSTIRDTAGFVVDTFTSPRRYLLRNENDLELLAVDSVNNRASLLDLEDIVQGDRYLFIRDLYLQRRDFSAKDGRVDDPFLDDSVDEEMPSTQDAPEAPAAPADTGPTNSGAGVLGSPETNFLLDAVAGDAAPESVLLVSATMAPSHPAAME